MGHFHPFSNVTQRAFFSVPQRLHAALGQLLQQPRGNSNLEDFTHKYYIYISKWYFMVVQLDQK